METCVGERYRGARTLAIDPRIRRVGYAYFEGASLLDWGVKNVQADVPSVRVRRRLVPMIAEMLDSYEPTALIVPDVRQGRVRRSRQVQLTVRAVIREATNRRIQVFPVTSKRVQTAFRSVCDEPRPNKEAINRQIVHWFPELQPSLPKARRLWESERHFTPLFDAIAMFCAWIGVPDHARGKRKSITPSKF